MGKRKPKDKNKESVLPKIACGYCGRHTQLSFDPTEEYSKLLGAICDFCGRYAFTPPTEYEIYKNRTA